MGQKRVLACVRRDPCVTLGPPRWVGKARTQVFMSQRGSIQHPSKGADASPGPVRFWDRFRTRARFSAALRALDASLPRGSAALTQRADGAVFITLELSGLMANDGTPVRITVDGRPAASAVVSRGDVHCVTRLDGAVEDSFGEGVVIALIVAGRTRAAGIVRPRS